MTDFAWAILQGEHEYRTVLAVTESFQDAMKIVADAGCYVTDEYFDSKFPADPDKEFDFSYFFFWVGFDDQRKDSIKMIENREDEFDVPWLTMTVEVTPTILIKRKYNAQRRVR